MLINNPLRQSRPRRLLLDVVSEWSPCCARHVVNDNIWLGCVTLKEIGEFMQLGNLPAILDADR